MNAENEAQVRGEQRGGGYSSSLSWNTLPAGVPERITAPISNNWQRLV